MARPEKTERNKRMVVLSYSKDTYWVGLEVPAISQAVMG